MLCKDTYFARFYSNRLLKITDLYVQNQDYKLQRLQKITQITPGLQAKHMRLQPCCGPLKHDIQDIHSSLSNKIISIQVYIMFTHTLILKYNYVVYTLHSSTYNQQSI